MKKKNTTNFRQFFELSFEEARAGVEQKHGGPFGAVIIKNGKVIAKSHNTVLRDNDPTAHAEVNAIRAACKKLKTPHLKECILITSSEPCPMCLTTSYWAQIKAIHYASRRQIAAGVGFADDFIYLDLAKKPETRSIPVKWQSELEEKSKKIFSWWKKLNGKLY